jgi:cbb3-type cytochrome oxidase maturation protein
MSVFLVILSGIMGLALAGLGAFLWAMKAGQFDDPKGSAARILDEYDRPAE